MDTLDELEKLLVEASLEATAKRKGPQPRPRQLSFSDPANWLPNGTVQLVHRDGNVETLIGLFDEFRHATSRDARRLVAGTLGSDMKPRIEYVSGKHWLGEKLETKRQTPSRVFQIVEDLVLDMGVSAPAVVLEISLVGGGISRVVLASDSRFEGFTPRTILLLPKGMDVLEGLSRETKVRIWNEVKRLTDAEE